MYKKQEVQVRERAHAIWEREGRPERRREEHWQQAWAEIEREGGSDLKEAYRTDVPPSCTFGG